MLNLPAYMTGLLVVLLAVGATVWRHHEQWEPMLRTAGAILLNWMAGTIYITNTGNYTPWHFNIFIDALAAFVVMYHPAGRVQAYIGVFYFFQIACHTVYGARELLGQPASPQYYYDAITWIAWAQLLAMGVWCGGIWCGDLVHRLWARRHAPDRRARPANSRKTQ